jgi:Ca2+-binding EF-hand superfamily protein
MKSKDQIFGDFLSGCEGDRGNKDAVITKEEFFDYYNDVSMSIACDEYFVEMMQNAWMIMEDETIPLLKEKTNELINTIRLKLQSVTKGNQTEFFLRKLYRQYNSSKSGYMTISEMEAMILSLGISIEKKYMTSVFKEFDHNSSGTVEFEEFCNFIVNSTYTKK